MVVKEKVLEWLDLGVDFRDKKDPEKSFLASLLQAVYPKASLEELDGLGSTTMKLRLLFGSQYYHDNPLDLESTIRLFTKKELGIILIDLKEEFSSSDTNWYGEDPGWMVYSKIIDEIPDWGDYDDNDRCDRYSFDRLLERVGDLTVYVRELKEQGYTISNNDFLSNDKNWRLVGVSS